VLDFPDQDEQDGPEGCLSIPGLHFHTKRRMNVVAKGYTADGDPVQVVGAGNLGRCLQHETDRDHEASQALTMITKDLLLPAVVNLSRS